MFGSMGCCSFKRPNPWGHRDQTWRRRDPARWSEAWPWNLRLCWVGNASHRPYGPASAVDCGLEGDAWTSWWMSNFSSASRSERGCRCVLWLTRRLRNQVNFRYTRHHRRKFLDSKVLGYGHDQAPTSQKDRTVAAGFQWWRQYSWHAQSTPPSFLLPLRDYSQLRPADPPLAFSPSTNNFDPRLSNVATTAFINTQADVRLQQVLRAPRAHSPRNINITQKSVLPSQNNIYIYCVTKKQNYCTLCTKKM